MSSATSINKRSLRLKADATGPDATDSGFRPWHFFVLASLAASTVAVILSRRSAPEHLILLSLTIGAAGAAAAAFYRTLAPLALRDVSLLSERPSVRALATLEREKALVLRSIKELEFDRAMGKVSAKDFDEMAGRLRARAIMLMKQVDAGGSGYRELIERELRTRLNAGRAGSVDPATAVRPDRLRQGYGESAEASAKAEDRALRESVEARACASCGTANDHDAAFCKRCGKSLAEVIP